MPRKKKTVTKKAPARRGRPPKVKAAEPATPARRGRPAKAKAAATPTAADQQMSVQVLSDTVKSFAAWAGQVTGESLLSVHQRVSEVERQTLANQQRLFQFERLCSELADDVREMKAGRAPSELDATLERRVDAYMRSVEALARQLEAVQRQMGSTIHGP